MSKYLSVSEEHTSVAEPALAGGRWRASRGLRVALWTTATIVLLSSVALLIVTSVISHSSSVI
jgi:hypothetical protein